MVGARPGRLGWDVRRGACGRAATTADPDMTTTIGVRGDERGPYARSVLRSAGTSLLDPAEPLGADFTAASGTVTRVASESFGAIAAEPANAQIEIRASWTPLDDAFGAHLLAWCDLLCTTSGLPAENTRKLHQERQQDVIATGLQHSCQRRQYKSRFSRHSEVH